MGDAPGTTPSTAFRRELFRPPCARLIESETTFDDIAEVPEPDFDTIEPLADLTPPKPTLAPAAGILLGGSALLLSGALFVAVLLVGLFATTAAAPTEQVVQLLSAP